MLNILRSCLRAVFLDVPWLIDSAWRRIDFNINSEFRYQPAGPPQTAALQRRSCWQKPVFWNFALTIVFIGYGPVWDGLCTLVPPPASAWALRAAGLALLFLAAPWLYLTMGRGSRSRIEGRFDPSGPAPIDYGGTSRSLRMAIAGLVILGLRWIALLPLIFASLWLFHLAQGDPGPCVGAGFAYSSLFRFLSCAAAIVAFGAVSSRIDNASRLIWIQGALVASTALVHWLSLAPPEATEASGLPYRHVFALVAPALCLTICLAPFLARAKFRPGPWLQPWLWFADSGEGARNEETRRRFAELLPRSELFVPRGADPDLTLDRVVHALVYGTLYRPLQLLLPPSLLAFVAPPHWLTFLVVLGFVFSVLMLTWGSVANRWQQMVIHVQRLFMSGTSLPVSIFVIVIAALRMLGVGYVTTVLDAAPFGVLFGAVFMSYVLSWLIEYWINRVAAVELLRVLGNARDDASMPYPLEVKRDPNIKVEEAGRYLMTHGIGRFLVVGTLIPEPKVQPRDGPPAGAPAGSAKGVVPGTAFHTYDLIGLFRALAGREDRGVMDIARHTNLYFYGVNAMLALVIAAFGLWHVASARRPSSLEAVVRARAVVPPDELNDLAGRLVSGAGVARPAVVVVASGGGTRAALYTAHVLEGLHRLGVDDDVVLMSGVSGGGVALAYFAANYERLAGPGAVEADWIEFKQRISGAFIEDVLEGATEWRIFGASPLTVLLAESFERRLPGATKRFEDLSAAPPLILNTTVVGHPADDSDLLGRTLDRVTVRSPADCVEEERPFTHMNGGRLVFTNLRNTSAFPPRQSRVADTRLPYRIVQDPAVTLAKAAALNANFPPVFPNARVVVEGLHAGSACPNRSYFVTDGGAEENLGLVSALFAVQSALEEIRKGCAGSPPSSANGKLDCPVPLRPIHFVIAEASATSYDYAQDRGVSAALSGAKERMTGGLTDMLIESSDDRYRELAEGGSGTSGLRFHYLALPLAFRARGGFGTHWMHAEYVTVADPRRRAAPRFQGAGSDIVAGTVTLNKQEIGALWSELHQPDASFCRPRGPARSGPETVREWICGGVQDAHKPRDGHVEEWKRLVDELE